MPCAPGKALPLVVAAMLAGCDVDRVRVLFPFDAGPLDDATHLCTATVSIDLNDDGEADVRRVYQFAPDGRLRTFEEVLLERGPVLPPADDGPLIALDDVNFESGVRTAFAFDDGWPDRLVAKSRLSSAAGTPSVVAKGGFVDDRLRTLELQGTTVSFGPRVVGIIANATRRRGVWRTDESGAWSVYDREDVLARSDGTGIADTSIIRESLHLRETSDVTSVGEATRTFEQSGSTLSSLRYQVDLEFDDDGLPKHATFVDLQVGAPDSILLTVTRAHDHLTIDAAEQSGPGAWSVVVDRSARGHVHRVQRPGSLVTCRVVVTDPLGTPLWLRNHYLECAPLVAEERDATGRVTRVVTTARTVSFVTESTCDDLCTLHEAAPLDDGSVLALANRIAPVSPVPVVLDAFQRDVADPTPSCAVLP